VSGAVDQIARDKAQKALDEIGSHEKLCAERYDNIHDKLGLVLKVLGWGGATIMTVLLGIAARSMTVNDDQSAVLKAKVELLEQQVHGPPAAGTPR
jgi:hypothetical protein